MKIGETNKVLVSIGLVTCLLAILLISACTTQQAAPTSTAAPTTTAAAGPKYGGTFKPATNIDGNTLGYPPAMLGYMVYGSSRPAIETLGRYDVSGVIQPYLLESWGEDAASKSFTLKLKKGIKFHDGSALDAAALKWNIERFYAAGRTEFPKATSVDIVDDYTVKIVLPAWDSSALEGLGYSVGPIISPTAWKNAPGAADDKARDAWCQNNPVGTGPFKFVSWTKTSKIVYKKFDGYWQKGKPYLDGIEWTIIADPTTEAAACKGKEVDVAWWLRPTVARDLNAAGYTITKNASGLGGQIKGLIGNSANPDSPFAKLEVRQALSYAIDGKAICDGVFYGYANPIQQWADPSSDLNSPNLKGYPFNPEKAKQLLAQAGYANGIKASILIQNIPDDTAIATAMQAMLGKVGITAELKPVDMPQYMQLTRQAAIDSLCLINTRTDPYPAVIYRQNVAKGAMSYSRSIIHPDDLEQAINDLAAAGDLATMKKLNYKVNELMFDKYCLFTPGLVTIGLSAKHPWVKGDGMMTQGWPTEWAPENAWLDK